MQNSEQAISWALKLYEKSPLKKKKFAMLSKMFTEADLVECLDIGSDNGTISYLLRQQGGNWHSADLTQETVKAIQSLGLEDVYQINGLTTPFENNQFDLVVIVDFLEHIETDQEFVNEINRILKPQGTLIINVPRPVNGPLRWIKNLVGQTDEAHGHVRPGYDLQDISNLLKEDFVIEKHEYYSRCFSVFIDALITFAIDILKGGRGAKGTVVTGDDQSKLAKSFKLYSLIYPLIAVFVKLDDIFSFLPGNMLIAKVQKINS